jgi:hypothetical protein
MAFVGKRINTAIDHILNEDWENALIQISIAMNATTKKKWSKKMAVGRRISNFIKEYEQFLFIVIKWILASWVRWHIAYDIDGKKTELPKIYSKLIRGALVHGGEELSDKFVFEKQKIGVESGKIIINQGHLLGFLLSVVVDPVNKDESCKNNPMIFYMGKNIFINSLWGVTIGAAIDSYLSLTIKYR